MLSFPGRVFLKERSQRTRKKIAKVWCEMIFFSYYSFSFWFTWTCTACLSYLAKHFVMFAIVSLVTSPSFIPFLPIPFILSFLSSCLYTTTLLLLWLFRFVCRPFYIRHFAEIVCVYFMIKVVTKISFALFLLRFFSLALFHHTDVPGAKFKPNFIPSGSLYRRIAHVVAFIFYSVFLSEIFLPAKNIGRNFFDLKIKRNC